MPRRFVFRHPLVRHAVYEGTPAGWRLAAHARAAAALRRGAAAAERAHHVEQSASPGDEDAIAVLLGPAGTRRRARAGGSGPLVRGCAAAAAGTTAARGVDVRVSLASALRSVGELERCRATLLEAIELLPATAPTAASS